MISLDSRVQCSSGVFPSRYIWSMSANCNFFLQLIIHQFCILILIISKTDISKDIIVLRSLMQKLNRKFDVLTISGHRATIMVDENIMIGNGWVNEWQVIMPLGNSNINLFCRIEDFNNTDIFCHDLRNKENTTPLMFHNKGCWIVDFLRKTVKSVHFYLRRMKCYPVVISTISILHEETIYYHVNAI